MLSTALQTFKSLGRSKKKCAWSAMTFWLIENWLNKLLFSSKLIRCLTGLLFGLGPKGFRLLKYSLPQKSMDKKSLE